VSPKTPVRTEPENGSKTAVSTQAPAQDPVAVGGLPERSAREAQVVVNRGTIVRLVRDRGFGFIRMENGTEVFFHATGMQNFPFDSLQEGQAVTFDIEQDTRGRGQRAVRVQLES
jgi:CspA family cold shock protein